MAKPAAVGSDSYTQSDAPNPKTVMLPLPDGVQRTLDDVIVATAEDEDGHASAFSFAR